MPPMPHLRVGFQGSFSKNLGLSAMFVVRASRLPSWAPTFWAAGTAAPQSSPDSAESRIWKYLRGESLYFSAGKAE